MRSLWRKVRKSIKRTVKSVFESDESKEDLND